MAKTTKYLSRVLNTNINVNSSIYSTSFSELHYVVPANKMARVDVLGYSFNHFIQVYVAQSYYGNTYAYFQATSTGLDFSFYHGLLERSTQGRFSCTSGMYSTYYGITPHIFNIYGGGNNIPIPGYNFAIWHSHVNLPAVPSGNISLSNTFNYKFSDYGNFNGNMHPVHIGNHERYTEHNLLISGPVYMSGSWQSYYASNGIGSNYYAARQSDFMYTPIIQPGNISLFWSNQSGTISNYGAKIGKKQHFYMGPGESLYINYSVATSNSTQPQTISVGVYYSMNFVITEEDI